MRSALLFLLAALASGQTVSNIRFDGVGHASMRVIFDVSSSYSDVRIRYGTSACTGGTGGTLQQDAYSQSAHLTVAMVLDIGGLNASTTYHVCPEVYNGSTWSSGVENTQATAAAPSPDPTTPTPPTTFNTAYPTQTGTTYTVMSDCSDLQTIMNSAVYGDTIEIPAGTICSAHYAMPAAPDAKTFTPSNVVSSTCTIAVTGHGYADHDGVRFASSGANSYFLPGSYPYGYGPGAVPRYTFNSGSFIEGDVYYVKYIDADHFQVSATPGGAAKQCGIIPFTADATADTITVTASVDDYDGYVWNTSTPIQLVSTGTLPGGLSADTDYYPKTACTGYPCSTQLALTNGGSAINLTSAGTGTMTIVGRGNGTMYSLKWPPADSWIVVRTAAPDSDLPPEGSQIDASYLSSMATLKQTTKFGGGQFLISSGILSHNWRFVGLEVTSQDSTEYLTTPDPSAYGEFFDLFRTSGNIIFDRMYVHCNGFPNRCGKNVAFIDAANFALIDSQYIGMDYWHPYMNLVATRVSGTQITAAAGYFHGGAFSTTLTGTTTITMTGGTSTGTGVVYFAMDGTLKVVLPTGMTATCTTTGTTCTVSTSASPAWPMTGGDASNRSSAGRWFTIALSGGSITSIDDGIGNGTPNYAFSQDNTEGTNGILAGNGPGPYIFDNDHFQGSGILVHFDDQAGGLPQRSDYTIRRVTVEMPQSQLAGGPSSDGYRYFNRQPLEWKGGQRISIYGGRCIGNYTDVTLNSVCYDITPVVGGYTTDVDIRHNSLLNVPGGVHAPPYITQTHASKPVQHVRLDNNLFLINGWTQSVGGNGRGWVTFSGGSMEDFIMTHNTVYDNRGTLPSTIWRYQDPMHGFKGQSNIFGYTGDSAMIRSEACGLCSGNDKALLDSAFPGYDFSGNVLVGSYSNTQLASGVVSASTISTAFSGLTNSVVPDQGSAAANWSYVGFTNPATYDFSLTGSSPYHNGCDSGTTDCGIDQAAMLDAQGVARSITVTPASTTATVTYTLTGKACQVRLSGGQTFSGTGSITITGLSPSTAYTGDLLCFFKQTADLGFSGSQLTALSFTTLAAPSGVVTGAISLQGAVAIQ